MELTARRDRARSPVARSSWRPPTRARRRSPSTRASLEPGACFVALRAARDGHDFVADAFARGATRRAGDRARSRSTGDRGRAGRRRVRRAGRASGAAARDALARRHRRRRHRLDRQDGTKDLLAAALAPQFHVHASPGSYNNEFGLPITLLRRADAATEALVLEMGERVPGDIAALCAIARPTVGVITNIGLAHAEHLGGPRRRRRVKGELLEALAGHGLAVLDADDAADAGPRRRARRPRGAGRRRAAPTPTSGSATSSSTPSCARGSGSSRRGVAAR